MAKDKIKQRQGLQVSPKELRRIANNLEKQNIEFLDETGILISNNKEFIVPIINKSQESDTWRFEI